MKTQNQVTLEFPSRSANESFARTAAACFAAQLDPTLEEINDIKTAVSEAVTNAIVHGYPDRLGNILLRLRILEENTLEILVRDKGVGIADGEGIGRARGGAACDPLRLVHLLAKQIFAYQLDQREIHQRERGADQQQIGEYDSPAYGIKASFNPCQ